MLAIKGFPTNYDIMIQRATQTLQFGKAAPCRAGGKVSGTDMK